MKVVPSSETRTSVDLSTVVQASPNQVSSRVGDEAAILDLDNSTYYSLDASGAHLGSPSTARDLKAVLAILLEEYDIDEPTARANLWSSFPT